MPRKIDVLANKVFTTQAGQELFDMLAEQFVNTNVYDPDPMVMARKAAEHDLIIYLGGLIQSGGRSNSDG